MIYSVKQSVHVLLVLLFLIINPNIATADPKPIKFAMAIWKPNSYIENNEIKGLAVQAARAYSQKEGLPLDVKVLPFKRLVVELSRQKVDCAVLPRGIIKGTTSERLALKALMKIFYKKSRAEEFNTIPETVIDLMGRTVILLRGATYNNLHLPLLEKDNLRNVLTVDSHVASVKILELERADFLLSYLAPFATGVKEAGLSLDDYASITVQTLDGYVVCTNPEIQQETVNSMADGSYYYLREALMPYGVYMPEKNY